MAQRSGASEVGPGVFRLGTQWANFYLVAADGEFLLVDAGYPRYWPQVERALERLGAPVPALAAVIVTHHHVDHAVGHGPPWPDGVGRAVEAVRRGAY